jgi:hypothetical protein
VDIYPVICFSVTLCLQITAETELFSDTNLHGKFDTFNTLFARYIRSDLAAQKRYTSHLPRLGPGTPRGMRSRSCWHLTAPKAGTSLPPPAGTSLPPAPSCHLTARTGSRHTDPSDGRSGGFGADYSATRRGDDSGIKRACSRRRPPMLPLGAETALGLRAARRRRLH